MEIRTITQNDFEKVDQLIRVAFSLTTFGYGNEAELVTAIRKSKSYVNSLEIVAEEKNNIIGHGLLSEGRIIANKEATLGLVLAPLEVTPESQGRGIGTAILQKLELRGKKLKYPFISILGHPDYYSRFGYSPASRFTIRAPFEIPDEAFMIKPLYDGALDQITGTLRYSEAFESIS